MDWIERLLHIAPDGGNGRLEFGIVIGIVIAAGMTVAGVAVKRRVRRWGTRVRAESAHDTV